MNEPTMIRKATIADKEILVQLMNELDYPQTEPFIERRISELLAHSDHELFLYEVDGDVAGCISIHYIPQLALAGDIAIISYLAVRKGVRSRGIGKLLEDHAVQQAALRKCDRIQVHSSLRRVDAHRFYERQGYVESPKYFSKSV